MRLLNAFSLNMLPEGFSGSITVRPLNEAAARTTIAGGVESAVGHPDTAALLGMPCVRATVTLEVGETALVAQYRGPRLPEGATSLPAGARIDWALITVEVLP